MTSTITTDTNGRKPYLSVREIPKEGFPMTEPFIRKLIRERKITVHQVGRNVRISRADLEAYMAACRRPAYAEAA